jgi:hypothetical protein
LALASTYHQITHLYPAISKAPSIEVGVRRTTLTFHIDTNTELFTIAYLAIVPFKDAAATHRNIIAVVNALQSQDIKTSGSEKPKRIEQLITALSQAIKQIDAIDPLKVSPALRMEQLNFFQAPTSTVITNSRTQTLNVYCHPAFGKHLMNQSSGLGRAKNALIQTPESTLPPVSTVFEFIKTFDNVGQSQ